MTVPPASFRAWQVDQDGRHAMRKVSIDGWPSGSVVLKTCYSSLNYKDALAASGHRGVVGSLPHVPGIDVAGVVAASDDAAFQPGDRVFVTGYDFGAPAWGGWSPWVRVPADWVCRLPKTIGFPDVMTLGTAGFTAAQCIDAIRSQEVSPDSGEILVTGASGGVGCLAVILLSAAGYRVVAITGKPDQQQWLRRCGAVRVMGREAICPGQADAAKPLLRAAWAGAVDTVGGEVLANVLKQVQHRGCVATCGNVAGTELHTTVFPFILRGLRLIGIDSARCPRGPRDAIWDALFSPEVQAMIADRLQPGLQVVPLERIHEAVGRMLAGNSTGRVIIQTASDLA